MLRGFKKVRALLQMRMPLLMTSAAPKTLPFGRSQRRESLNGSHHGVMVVQDST